MSFRYFWHGWSVRKRSTKNMHKRINNGCHSSLHSFFLFDFAGFFLFCFFTDSHFFFNSVVIQIDQHFLSKSPFIPHELDTVIYWIYHFIPVIWSQIKFLKKFFYLSFVFVYLINMILNSYLHLQKLALLAHNKDEVTASFLNCQQSAQWLFSLSLFLN